MHDHEPRTRLFSVSLTPNSSCLTGLYGLRRNSCHKPAQSNKFRQNRIVALRPSCCTLSFDASCELTFRITRTNTIAVSLQCLALRTRPGPCRKQLSTVAAVPFARQSRRIRDRSSARGAERVKSKRTGASVREKCATGEHGARRSAPGPR